MCRHVQVLPSSEEFNADAYLGYIHAVSQKQTP